MTGHWFHGSRQLCVVRQLVGMFDPTLSVSAGISNGCSTRRQKCNVDLLGDCISNHTLVNRMCMNFTHTQHCLCCSISCSSHTLPGLVSQVLRFVFYCFVFIRIQIRALRRHSFHSSCVCVLLHRFHYDTAVYCSICQPRDLLSTHIILQLDVGC